MIILKKMIQDPFVIAIFVMDVCVCAGDAIHTLL